MNPAEKKKRPQTKTIKKIDYSTAAKLLSSKNDDDIIKAAKMLAKIDEKKSVALLLHSLYELDYRYRSMSCLSAFFGDPKVVYTKGTPENAVANALKKIGGSAVIPLLKLHYANEEDFSLLARETMIMMGKIAIPPLFQMISPKYRKYGDAATYALADIHDPKMVKSLKNLFHNGTPKQQWAAIYILAAIDDPRTNPLIHEALKSKNVDVVVEAIHAIGKNQNTETMEILNDFLKNPNSKIAGTAASVLGKKDEFNDFQISGPTYLGNEPIFSHDQIYNLCCLPREKISPAVLELLQQALDAPSMKRYSSIHELKKVVLRKGDFTFIKHLQNWLNSCNLTDEQRDIVTTKLLKPLQTHYKNVETKTKNN